MAIRIIRNVPENKLNFYEQLFKDTGATSVSHAKEEDGEYTITAIFPDVERHSELAERIKPPE